MTYEPRRVVALCYREHAEAPGPGMFRYWFLDWPAVPGELGDDALLEAARFLIGPCPVCGEPASSVELLGPGRDRAPPP